MYSVSETNEDKLGGDLRKAELPFYELPRRCLTRHPSGPAERRIQSLDREPFSRPARRLSDERIASLVGKETPGCREKTTFIKNIAGLPGAAN